MTAKIAQSLIKLAQLDIDAIQAYEQALSGIDSDEYTEIYSHLQNFKADHIQHVEDLSHHIRQLGEDAPSYTLDVKGFLIKGFTAIRSLTGISGALKAMESNEELTNRVYCEHLECLEGLACPEAIKTLVQKNYQDEQKHLEYIRNVLKEI